MKDRRSVDDLSVDELQRVLSEKKRLAREARLAKYRETGRALPAVPVGTLPDGHLEALPSEPPRPRSLRRRVLDGLLLIVEVAAVVGLIYVLYNGTTILEQLNREAQQLMSENVQALPTIGPTPMVVAVVLPSGHTPPDKLTGLSQPNDNEIPANLRPLVQAMPPPVVPTQGPSQANRIVIPAINVDAQIVQGDGWEQLKKGVGQHIGTADPGQPGNMVLSAHNDIYGEIFRQLDQLKPGDEIQVQTTTQVYNYVVSSWRVVPPTDVSALSPTAHPSLTLISCYPYLVDTERIVVTADLKTQ